MFARFTQTDGKRGDVQLIVNRDRLMERVTMQNDVVHQLFKSGRPSGMKRLITKSGITQEVEFYANSRADGLYRRVDTPRKVLFYFSDRDDKLYYISATFEATEVHLTKSANS